MTDWLGCEKDYTKALQDAREADVQLIHIKSLEDSAGTYLSRVSNSSQTMFIATSASAAEKDHFPKLIKMTPPDYTTAEADS